MIADAPTVAAYSLVAYLNGATLIDATTAPSAYASTKVERVDRSFTGGKSWNFIDPSNVIQSPTVASDNTPVLIGAQSIEDAAIAEILEFGRLKEGWDGENGAVPNTEAIKEAVRFLRLVPAISASWSSTLHVDGSVVLETFEGMSGSLRFAGDGKVSYAILGKGARTVVFDGQKIPLDIADILND